MDLTDSQAELVQQFREITGVDEESQSKVADLLKVNDWNINNSISTYLDSGFESISNINTAAATTNTTNANDTAEGVSSGVGLEEYESNLYRREDSRSVVNLQNQMFFDNYVRKLPKAPRISGNWQLEVGIHMSIRDKETVTEKDNGTDRSLADDEKSSIDNSSGSSDETTSSSEGKGTTLWIILLFIPKSLLSVLISIFKFFFGTVSRKVTTLHNFPRDFSYLHYDPRDENKVSFIPEDPSLASTTSISSSSFNDVHAKCQTKYSWLLVILTDNDPKSLAFAKAFLSNPSIKGLKDTEIFINNATKSREAYEVGVTYKVKNLPYVMLVANVTNNPSVMSSMSIVYKSNLSQRSIESEELVNATVNKVYKGLNKVVEHFNPQLITQRIDQQEIEFSRLIKEQQDAAYIESLARDKQKKEEKAIQTKLVEEQKNLLQLRRNFLLTRIQNGWIEEVGDSNAEDSVKLAIKLPHGQRLIQVLPKSVLTLELYLFVELKLYIHELVNRESGEDDDENEFNDENDVIVHAKSLSLDNSLTLEEYYEKFPFKFELIQPFPKRVIKIADSTGSIGEVKELKSGGNLLVEYIDDEEDDDEYEE